MIYFTSDTHFNHSNIIRYCNRPFANITEHDETIIKNWNSIVQKKDTVYHLGDFGFGSPTLLYHTIASRLNGKIYLIKGNHDKEVTKEPLVKRFESIRDVQIVYAQYNKKKYKIFLSHYPHRSWPYSFHNSIHLFGHVHGRLKPHGKSFDVGVDANAFYVLSLYEVISYASHLSMDEPHEAI